MNRCLEGHNSADSFGGSSSPVRERKNTRFQNASTQDESLLDSTINLYIDHDLPFSLWNSSKQFEINTLGSSVQSCSVSDWMTNLQSIFQLNGRFGDVEHVCPRDRTPTSHYKMETKQLRVTNSENVNQNHRPFLFPLNKMFEDPLQPASPKISLNSSSAQTLVLNPESSSKCHEKIKKNPEDASPIFHSHRLSDFTTYPPTEMSLPPLEARTIAPRVNCFGPKMSSGYDAADLLLQKWATDPLKFYPKHLNNNFERSRGGKKHTEEDCFWAGRGGAAVGMLGAIPGVGTRPAEWLAFHNTKR